MYAGAYGDEQLQRQVLEKLVDVDAQLNPVPVLATKWSSADGKVWKFTLRDGVTFTNGEAFTSADVIYTMDRLRSKKLGSVMADVYANVDRVVADDPTHVTFYLKSVDSEFPATLTDMRTLMLCKSVKDPMKQLVGTGPFMLESFAAEDRAVLKANPNYWGRDADGNRLPYLDGVSFIYSPDMTGQVEGLQGGSLDWVGGLSSELRQTVEGSPGIKVFSIDSNNVFTLQIRCDQGPGKDVAFRQALMAGTDRQALVDLVAPGDASPGNGTIVGPAYAANYLQESVPFDPAKAKELLASAGYANGLEIKLVVQTLDPWPAIATAWQAQMKTIGVSVSISQVPSDVFWANTGTNSWTQVEFCGVDWSTRVPPSVYFQLGFITDSPWNMMRWSDPAFDQIVKQLPQQLDETKRADSISRRK